MGLGKLAFEKKEYKEAGGYFRSVCNGHPSAGAAPEACYWSGVAEYKATQKPAPLQETARVLEERYPTSEWARKASVWAAH
jgi:TolA-binding protein